MALQEGLGKQRKLAAKIGKAPAQISQWINGTRTLREETAREIEHSLGLPERWMDSPRDAEQSHWPLPLVDYSRWRRLSAADRAYVQGVMMQAIAEREVASKLQPYAAPKLHATHTVHEPRSKYRT